jgi:predicted AAA+ superfamily ATPase
MDTGLAAFLMKYPDSQTLSKGNHNGNILENFVISEVLKNKMHVQKQFEPYFYRDSNHNEIDLVLDFGLSLKLIEIKMNKTIQKKHYQTLLTQSPFFSGAHCFILSLFEDEVQITKHIKNVHINNMLSLL